MYLHLTRSYGRAAIVVNIDRHEYWIHISCPSCPDATLFRQTHGLLLSCHCKLSVSAHIATLHCIYMGAPARNWYRNTILIPPPPSFCYSARSASSPRPRGSWCSTPDTAWCGQQWKPGRVRETWKSKSRDYNIGRSPRANGSFGNRVFTLFILISIFCRDSYLLPPSVNFTILGLGKKPRSGAKLCKYPWKVSLMNYSCSTVQLHYTSNHRKLVAMSCHTWH
jgi:hypothetical protein